MGDDEKIRSMPFPLIPLEVLERQAKKLGEQIGSVLEPPARFLLMLWTLPEPGGWLTFISNSQRADILSMLVEFIGRQASDAGGPRALRGRALHRIITDADDLWGSLEERDSEMWCTMADEFAAIVAALPITEDEGGTDVDRPDAGEAPGE